MQSWRGCGPSAALCSTTSGVTRTGVPPVHVWGKGMCATRVYMWAAQAPATIAQSVVLFQRAFPVVLFQQCFCAQPNELS